MYIISFFRTDGCMYNMNIQTLNKVIPSILPTCRYYLLMISTTQKS